MNLDAPICESVSHLHDVDVEIHTGCRSCLQIIICNDFLSLQLFYVHRLPFSKPFKYSMSPCLH